MVGQSLRGAFFLSCGTRTAGWGWIALATTSAVAFAVLASHAARVETPTIDEFAHVPAGFSYLAGGSFEHYAKNPPLMQMGLALPGTLAGDVVVPPPQRLSQAWGPWVYGGQFMTDNAANYFRVFALARHVVIAVTLATALLLFVWARALFGLPGAAISTSLFLLSPMILGHGHLATVDVACMGSIFAACFALRWACGAPSLARMVGVGAVLAIALGVKFTALLVAPLFPIAVLIAGRADLRRATLHALALFASALFFVNAAMGFDGSFAPLASYSAKSELVQGLAAWLPDALPVPLPRAYLVGFDAVRVDTERGEFGSYLLGIWSPSGRWYYNGVAFAVKTPLPLLVLLLATPWFLYRAGVSRSELAFVLVPPIVLVIALALFNRAGIGLRYLLPIHPFLFVLTASVFAALRPRVRQALAALAIGWYAVVAAIDHPAHLASFNALAGGAENGHLYLVDSNLDWGQDLYRLPEALASLDLDEPIGLLYFGHVHPALYGIDYRLVPPRPARGVFAVSTTFLMGNPYVAMAPDGEMISIARDHAAWLRDRDPVARAGSIWIFDTRSE